MNIFKTFETFLKEPLSILKENFIQIISLQTENIFANKPSVDVTVQNGKTQVERIDEAIINNEKMYNLLSYASKRQKMKEQNNSEKLKCL